MLLQKEVNTRGDYRPFDFHIHSNLSDGTYSPSYIVQDAKRMGVDLIAITDHDSVNGVKEARTAGEEEGVTVISGVEIDTQFECELHILGLGIDIENPYFTALLDEAKVHREYRNRLITEKLAKHGLPIDKYLHCEENATVTRLNIAKAIVDSGNAETFAEAFEKYLAKGAPGYVFVERTDKRKAIEAIHKAGGMAVLAHPCKLKCDVNPLINTLADYGLDGLEVYYPTATQGQTDEFLAYAKRYSLYVSCGSDYHGANRKKATIGCAYKNTECLNLFAQKMLEINMEQNS